jgi:hypothetical protein
MILQKGMKMNKFIGFKEQKIVNLNRVSNIYVVKNSDSSGKIVFNLDYSVKIFKNEKGSGLKYSSDYVYWMFTSKEELNRMINLIQDNLSFEWFVPNNYEKFRYINMSKVSTITKDDKKLRIIFNLCYNVTHPRDENKVTSDFVFFDFSTTEEYNNFIDEISTYINF